MKITTLVVLILSLTRIAVAMDLTRDFLLKGEEMVLAGKQSASPFSSFQSESLGLKDYAVQTSVRQIVFTGATSQKITRALKTQDSIQSFDSKLILNFESNVTQINEVVTLSCEVQGHECLLSYDAADTVKEASGLPGSGRSNIRAVKSIADLVRRARSKTPVVDFTEQDSFLAETDLHILRMEFRRRPLEKILSDAGVCKRRFASSGGVYGPGAHSCILNLPLMK